MEKINHNIVTSPVITVFMATYNSSRYIAASVQSILNQSFSDFELLIVNDGSTDDTITIVKSFDDPRIRILNNDVNRGLTYTRNRGLKEAKGEYFAILDSDDIAMKDRLLLQYDFMKNNPNVVLCGGQAMLINDNDDEIGLYSVPTDVHNLREQMVFRNIFINPACMMRTEIVRQIGGYRDYAPAEDFDLFLRLVNKYQTDNLESVLIKYRVHASNASGKDSPVRLQERRIIQNIHRYVGLETDESLVDVHHAIFLSIADRYTLNDIRHLLKGLKIANNGTMVYDKSFFNYFLFERWLSFLRSRKVKMNALSLYFDSTLFEWRLFTFKDFRRMLKLSIKGVGRISR